MSEARRRGRGRSARHGDGAQNHPEINALRGVVKDGAGTELKGETMTGVLALVSPGFFDRLISYAKVEEAYKYFSSTGAQPLREDTHRRFPFAGIVFEEYKRHRHAFYRHNRNVGPGQRSIAFPLGTMDTFVTYGAPANLIETVNTVGLPIYARQIARPDTTRSV